MVLLALLARERLVDPASVIAAHFDHGLRGDDGAADGELVATAARLWGARVVRGEGDVTVMASGRGGPQAAAREARYAFLTDVVRERNAAQLLTAHHRDDRVETVLHRIVRGTGPSGLAALKPIERLRGTLVVRPLLAFSRRDIEVWAERTDVPFRIDPSNHDPRFTRTRVRDEVLPLLKEINPRADEAIVRLSALAGSDSALLDSTATALAEDATESREPGCWRLAARPLITAPSPILARVVRSGWWWIAGEEGPPPCAEWVAGAVAFLRRGRGGRIELPGRGEVRRTGSWIEFIDTGERKEDG